MNIKEKLQELIQESYFDPYEIFNPYNAKNIKNWPTIPLYMDYDEHGIPIPEDDPELELLDLENWKITEIGDKNITMKCGGDWQQPHEVKIELNSDDELEVISCQPSDFEGPELDMNEILGLEGEEDY